MYRTEYGSGIFREPESRENPTSEGELMSFNHQEPGTVLHIWDVWSGSLVDGDAKDAIEHNWIFPALKESYLVYIVVRIVGFSSDVS